MDNMLELLLVILAITFILAITTAILQSLWLKKSKIKNWGLGFVPIFSTYKMLHYFYDLFNSKKLNTLDSKSYVKERRKWSWIFTAIVIVISIVFSSIGIQMDNAELQSNNGTSVSLFLSLVQIIFAYILFYSMFRSVSKVSSSTQSLIEGQLSPVKSMIYSLLSIFTLGIFHIVAFIVFLSKDNYQYVLSDRVNEHEIDN